MSTESAGANRPVLAGVLLVLLAAGAIVAPVAIAGTPAAVTVRVLVPTGSGAYESLIPITQVTTSTVPVTKDEGSCPGTSAIGALDLATEGNWAGKLLGAGLGVETIDGRSLAEPEYWGFWRNDTYQEEGVCKVEAEPGDQLLFFPECFSKAKGQCPPEPQVLGIEAPATVEVGEPVTIAVYRYDAEGRHSPAAGVTVGGWGSSAQTNFEGEVTLTFPGDETYTLRATGASGEDPVSVPGEALVCAHTGEDGECGTARSPSGSIPTASSSSTATVAAPSSKPAVKPKAKTLTRAQRLAKALKACHERAKGRRRAACVRLARKRYGTVKKSKSK